MRSQKKVVAVVLHWYAEHARTHLPWRNTRDPYRILVSEVMLQQTQVDRVIPKYQEFLRLFPTVEALAAAPSSDVIVAWQGLGYNRRALFLKKTAEAVVQNHAGVFPQDIEELKRLPGIGDYTARALLSFAFEQAVPMMDTNHRRLYERVFFSPEQKPGQKKSDAELLACAEKIIPKRRAYDWNQALMDFGSSVCTSRKPSCHACPLQTVCRSAFQVEEKKKTSVATKPFIETDRYVRGRIVDSLRKKSPQKEKDILQLFSAERALQVHRCLVSLEKNGLLHRRDGRILLGERIHS